MKQRRGERSRRKTFTRTYPIYIISSPDLSNDNDHDDDDENIVEVKPIKRYRRHRKHHSKVKPFREYVIAGKDKRIEDIKKRRSPSATETKSERRQRSANVQTDEISSIESTTDKNNEQISNEKTNHRCLRIFTIILTMFLIIVSALLLAFSLNLLVNPNITKIRTVAIVYPQALPSSGFSGKGPTDTLLVTAIIGIVVGSLMLAVSIFTLIVVICIKFRYYGCCFFLSPCLLFLLFIILVGFALFIIITGTTELQRLAWSTQTTVLTYYNSTYTSLVRDGWDFVQYYFSCCGVMTNNTDWYPAPSTGWKYNSQLPRSCCGYDSNDIGHAGRIFVGTSVPTLVGFCYYGDIGQPTCYDSIKTNLLVTVLVFLIVTALIFLILGILMIILLVFYRSIHESVKK